MFNMEQEFWSRSSSSQVANLFVNHETPLSFSCLLLMQEWRGERATLSTLRAARAGSLPQHEDEDSIEELPDREEKI